MKQQTINPEDYLNLGYKVANVFLTKNPHLYYLKEDLEQEAALAVVEGARKWKDQGTIAFSTYCAIEAQNAILKFLRDSENKYRRIAVKSLEDLVLTPESEAISWEELVEGSIVNFSETLDALTPEVRRYVDLVNEGYGKRKIRKKLGIGWKQLNALEQRVIEELKEKCR